MGAERFRAPEILFNPEIIGLEYPGVHQIVVEAIHRTDMDLRKALYGNIVLSGGSTLTKGFGNRLLHEVQRLAVKDMRIKILAPPERIYTTWTGGSILAGLSTFKKASCSSMWRIEKVTNVLTMERRCGWKRTSGRRIPILFIRSLHKRSRRVASPCGRSRNRNSSMSSLAFPVGAVSAARVGEGGYWGGGPGVERLQLVMEMGMRQLGSGQG